MSYAVIEMGGKQYRVEKGDSVVVDRLDAKEGAKVTPRALLYADGNKAVLDGPELDKVKVEAVVAEHLKGEKIRVFKYRPKKRYRRTHGPPLAADAARDQRDQMGRPRPSRAAGSAEGEAKPRPQRPLKAEAAKPKSGGRKRSRSRPGQAGAARRSRHRRRREES